MIYGVFSIKKYNQRKSQKFKVNSKKYNFLFTRTRVRHLPNSTSIKKMLFTRRKNKRNKGNYKVCNKPNTICFRVSFIYTYAEEALA